MTLLLRYYNLNRICLFLIIVSGNLILTWLSKSVLINETVFYNAYSEQLSYDRALKLFNDLKDYSWLSYVISPIVLLVKFSLVSFVLYIGIIFTNIQFKVSVGSVFKIVIASDIVFLFAGLAKFTWFWFFAGNYNLNDIGFFYPLSLINLFNVAEVEKIWVHPLQTVNLFHLVYLLMLSYGLNKVCSIENNSAEKIVLFSYLPGLILWISLIMFITMDLMA